MTEVTFFHECDHCGLPFEKTNNRQKYCKRDECKKSRKKENNRRFRAGNKNKKRPPVPCIDCGTVIEAPKTTQKRCTDCAKEKRRQRYKKKAIERWQEKPALMECPACKQYFVPTHLRQEYCKDEECVAARQRAYARKSRIKKNTQRVEEQLNLLLLNIDTVELQPT